MSQPSLASTAAPAPPCSIEWRGLGDLTVFNAPKADWLWQGFLARGAVTLLTSQWKTGKTTLLSVLLARMHSGGSLAGLAVSPASVAVVSEESPVHWQSRRERLDFGPRARLACRPFTGKPDAALWQSLIEALAQPWEGQPADVVVLDTLSAFLPRGGESHADLMLNLLRSLERLTAQGQAVLLLHHPRKGVSRQGQAARGTGSLTSYVDISIEMTTVSKASADRRRRLAAYSRFEATPRELYLELDEAGCDYAVVNEPLADKVVADLDFLIDLVRMHERQLTRKQIWSLWPEPGRPSEVTLWRWLDRLVADGRLVQFGTGSNRNPLRYQPPGPELPYVPDPYAWAAEL